MKENFPEKYACFTGIDSILPNLARKEKPVKHLCYPVVCLVPFA
jgi:hypothetical protein